MSFSFEGWGVLGRFRRGSEGAHILMIYIWPQSSWIVERDKDIEQEPTRDGIARPPGPENSNKIRPEIFDFEPGSGLKLGQTKPKISGTMPTNRHTKIPNDSGPTFDVFRRPKLVTAR